MNKATKTKLARLTALMEQSLTAFSHKQQIN